MVENCMGIVIFYFSNCVGVLVTALKTILVKCCKTETQWLTHTKKVFKRAYF